MTSIDSEWGGRPTRGCGTGYAPENRRTPLNKLTRPKNSVVNVKYSHGFVVAASPVAVHYRANTLAGRRDSDPSVRQAIHQRPYYIQQLDTDQPVSILESPPPECSCLNSDQLWWDDPPPLTVLFIAMCSARRSRNSPENFRDKARCVSMGPVLCHYQTCMHHPPTTSQTCNFGTLFVCTPCPEKWD